MQILKEKYSKINEVIVKGTHKYFGWYKGQLENAWYRCVWDIKQPRERETNWPWSFISATTSTLLTCYPFLENIYFGRDVDRFSSPWNIYNFFRNILAGPCTNTNTVQIQCAMMRNSENQNRNHNLKMLQKCTLAKEVDSEYQRTPPYVFLPLYFFLSLYLYSYLSLCLIVSNSPTWGFLPCSPPSFAGCGRWSPSHCLKYFQKINLFHKRCNVCLFPTALFLWSILYKLWGH